MGVRRAVDMALAERRNFPPGEERVPVKTMGTLIHNPQVMESLRARGIGILDGRLPPDLRDTSVIIRAHGIPPGLEKEIRSRGGRVVDATCPKVKASQMKARSLAEKGYVIFLAGEARHGEIIGILGYAPDCITVADPAEAEQAAESLYRERPHAGTALLGQTTISPGEYEAIGAAVRRFFPGLECINTICGATRDRQNALEELCGRTQALIVAGGRESANTRRLLMIAEKRGKPAWLAENAADLPGEIFRYDTVGLSAGASTPDEVIDEIERVLLQGPVQGKTECKNRPPAEAADDIA
jgi:4-hydroxy-3-methylbut-2-enyl diphosphate reductase